MTGTEDSTAHGNANALSALSAARCPGAAAIAALLAIIASFVLDVHAAKATDIALTRLELATVINGRAYHRWSDDGGASWSSWADLGAPSDHPLQGTPAVVSDYPGRIYVISLSDDGFWQNMYNQGSWSGWTKIAGHEILCDEAPPWWQVWNWGAYLISCEYTYGASPVVTSWGAGRLDLFAYAYSQYTNDIRLVHTWADNYSWTGQWEDLGSVAAGSTPPQGAPGAVSWGWGRIDAFVRGPSNELLHKWFDNGNWSSGWENLGGILTSPPVVASPGSGRLNIFTRGTDGHLWGIWFAGGWGGWGDVGCCLAGDVTNSVAVASRAPLTLDVFVTGTLHDLYRKGYDYYGGGWAGWQYLDHVFDYTNIAAAGWTPVAPPSPPPPPGGGGGGGGGGNGCHQPCILPP